MVTRFSERALYLAVVMFMVLSLLIGIGIGGAPSGAQAQVGPSPIPSSHAGRTTCAACHSTGVAGAPVSPTNHATFPDALSFCQSCHQAGVAATPHPVATAMPAPPPTPAPVPPIPVAATLAIIFPANADGGTGLRMGYDFATEKGLKVIAELKYPPGDFAVLEKMTIDIAQSFKPGSVYIGGSSEKEAAVIQEILKKVGYAGKVIVGPIGSEPRPPQTTHVNMGWNEAGPVFGPSQMAQIPSVVQLNARLFVMYYQSGSGVKWATSADGATWSDRGPIIVTGELPSGYQLMRPSVVFWRETVGVVPQEHFLMYASAVLTIGGINHSDYIVVLQSTDGLNWSYAGTPFTEASPGVDPRGTLYGMTVVKTDSGYQGWLAQNDATFYTTSPDGLSWSPPQPTTGLPGAIQRPSVVRLAGKYAAWYNQALNPGGHPLTAIGMALSDDGINWTPSPENPLFNVEPDSWRSEMVFGPWVVLDEFNGVWRMWFTGRTSHVQANTEFLALDPASPTDTPSPGRFARGVSDPGSIVAQLRFPSTYHPVEAVNSIGDDDGHSYVPANMEAGGKLVIGGWDTLNGGSKPATTETLTVKYNQRLRDYSLGYAQASTHILADVVQKASWGDEIIVHPGVYLGQVYSDKALRLRSSNGPALTVVEARREQKYATPQGSYPAIWLNASETAWSGLSGSWWQKFGLPETRIEGFTALNSSGNGIALHLLPGDKAKLGPGGRVLNNVARGINGRGIVVVSSSGNMRLENNHLHGNSAGGIHVIASAWVGLFNNNVHDNANREGIFLESLSGDKSYAHVEDNTVQNNGGQGILSTMNDGRFVANTIAGNAGEGLKVEPGSATGLDNTVQNNGGHGVFLAGNGRQVARNNITSNGGYGIYATGTVNLISANQITGNQQGGILAEGDNNRILGNTIQGNAGNSSGIHLTASAEGNQVHYNNISGNSSHGLFKEGLPQVDAINNWWGQASGPSGSGPGTGDAVNENVLFAPWLVAPFPGDTTPPVIDEALALPNTLATYALADKLLGPTGATFAVRANDEHSGATSARVNMRPLAEMLSANLQIPSERQADWQSWLQSLENRGMRYNGMEWEGSYDLHWLVDEIAKRFSDWGIGEIVPLLPFKLVPGDVQLPVMVSDSAGNQATSHVSLTIVNAMVPLNEGWNLRSLPVALDDDSWGNVLATGDGLAADVALRFDETTQRWQALSNEDRWRPLDGVYIHATEPDQLALNVGRSPTAPPLRELAAGWALVGPAPSVGTGQTPVTDALRSLEVNASGQRGYLVATSPVQLADYRQLYRHELPGGSWRDYGAYDWHFEQIPWAYLSGDAWQGQMMTPGGGYWVFMEHPDSLVGFSSTPIVSSMQPQAAGLTPKPATAGGPPPLPMVLRVSSTAGWSNISAKVGARVVGQLSGPGDTLLVQGDLARNVRVNFYIDGVIADQKVSYENGKVANISLTLGGRADTNGDHVVDLIDLVEVASRFNARITAGDPADVNGDGVVNILDLVKVGMRFGRQQP